MKPGTSFRPQSYLVGKSVGCIGKNLAGISLEAMDDFRACLDGSLLDEKKL